MNRKLPANMSLLDYLWATFGEYEIGKDGIITAPILEEYLKEYGNDYITDIKLVPKSEDTIELVLYSSNGSIINTLEIDREDHLVKVENILSSQEEIDLNICTELNTPLVRFTMKSGKKHYIELPSYKGVETNAIITAVANNRIAAHLKIDKSIETPVVDVKVTENGLRVDLSTSNEDSTVKLIKTEDGLKASYTWEDGEDIKFEAISLDKYSLKTPAKGTIYFITDANCIYLNKVKYGPVSIPVVSTAKDGLMSKEDKQTLDNIPEVYTTKEDVSQLKADLQNYVSTILKNYALKSDDELAAMLKAGGDVIVAGDIDSAKGYTLTKDSNIDLNGHALDAASNGNYGDNVVIGNGANITISNGTINPATAATEKDASATIIVKTAYASTLTLNDCKVTGIYPLYVNSANENTLVTINGGEYYTTSDSSNPDNMPPAVYVGKGNSGSKIGGKVIINSGIFGQKGVTNNYLLNVEDILRQQEGKEPRDFIEVFGGTFINFDPSNNKSEGPGTNFVAEGKTVELIQDGPDIIYKVV